MFIAGFSSTRKNQGFSLIELMVALVVGLVVILGAGQLFLTAKQTYNQMEGLSIRQQSLRAISDFVSLDIRTASEVIDNAGDTATLSLLYEPGTRPNDPYCSGTASLTSIEYRFKDEDGYLYVAVSCEGSSPDEQELVRGLNDVRFTPDPERTLDEGLFIWIDIEFPPLEEGEPLEKTQYRTIVARRANVLS